MKPWRTTLKLTIGPRGTNLSSFRQGKLVRRNEPLKNLAADEGIDEAVEVIARRGVHVRDVPLRRRNLDAHLRAREGLTVRASVVRGSRSRC